MNFEDKLIFLINPFFLHDQKELLEYTGKGAKRAFKMK